MVYNKRINRQSSDSHCDRGGFRAAAQKRLSDADLQGRVEQARPQNRPDQRVQSAAAAPAPAAGSSSYSGFPHYESAVFCGPAGFEPKICTAEIGYTSQITCFIQYCPSLHGYFIGYIFHIYHTSDLFAFWICAL